MLKRNLLIELYERLYGAYGPQHWWPADSPFEVMVGAVLTQNTAWTNVEKAIVNLKNADKLDLPRMHRMTEKKLAQLITPAGYFNVKAKRLKALCKWTTQQGGLERLNRQPTEVLRTNLLQVHGIGPETADDILLYAFERPVFVIDAYTRRLLKKLKLIKGDEDYESLRSLFESSLAPDVLMFNEYHALIVRHNKEKCVDLIDCVHCKIEKPLLK